MITFNTPKLAKNNTSETLDFSSTNIQADKEIDLLLTEPSPTVVTPDAGYLGVAKVTINHPPVEELTEAEITQNGEFHITPSEGYDATLGVTVNVQVGSSSEYSDVDGMKYSNSTITEFPTGWKFAPRSFSINYMFADCINLRKFPELNCEKVNDTENMFSGCQNITELGKMTGLKVDVSFPNLDGLSPGAAETLFNSLGTVTGKTISFTLGAISAITDEVKAIATNKGWTIAVITE